VADEVTPVLTQADIDKAVADAIAKQKAADDADANVSVGHYKVDKKWLKWAVSAILLLAYANGFLDKETVTTLITTFPMSKAPEKPAEPPTLAAPTAVSPDDVAKWIDIFKPLIQQIIDGIPKPPIPVDPKPQPKPDPKPDPVVIVPQPIGDGIKAIDASGKPLTGDVEPGHQFRVVAGTAGRWDYQPKNSPDIDVTSLPDQLVVTLRNGASITAFHSTAESVSSLIVKCLKGAQPPPVVVVPDPVDPPVDGKPRALIVYESSDGTYTKDQLQALNSTTVAAALGSQTAGWRKWDKDLTAGSESAPWPDIWAAVKPKAIEAGLPAVAVIRGNSIKVHSISSEADILSALRGK